MVVLFKVKMFLIEVQLDMCMGGGGATLSVGASEFEMG